MREEVAYRFKVPARNLSRWKKEEAAGKFKDQKAGQRRAGGGGRGRLWMEMEKALFEQFRERRAIGRPVRRGWFRKVSRELFQIHYPEKDLALFRFSNGWFRNFLRWHQISLRCITNTASKLPGDFGGAILAWLRFNRGNSQLREGEQSLALEDTANPERLAIG